MDPAFYLPRLEIFVGRTIDHTFDLYQADGTTPLVIDVADNVRFKLWATDGAAPALEMDSAGPHAATFTADAPTDTCTSAAHELADGDAVRVSSSGTLPAPLAAATDYYVRDAAAGTFKLAATPGGAAIDLTTAGAGTHTWTVRRSRVTVNDLGTPGTTPARITARFHQLDLADLAAGDYTGEALLVDADDDGLAKPLFRVPITVAGSATGALGLA